MIVFLVSVRDSVPRKSRSATSSPTEAANARLLRPMAQVQRRIPSTVVPNTRVDDPLLSSAKCSMTKHGSDDDVRAQGAAAGTGFCKQFSRATNLGAHFESLAVVQYTWMYTVTPSHLHQIAAVAVKSCAKESARVSGAFASPQPRARARASRGQHQQTLPLPKRRSQSFNLCTIVNYASKTSIMESIHPFKPR